MKTQINLYQPSCYPKREKATFIQFLGLLGCCILAVLVLHLFLNKQLTDAQEKNIQHKDLLVEKQAQLRSLVAKMQNNRALDVKVHEQTVLEDEIKAKRMLLTSLSGIELGTTVNFSTLMRGLSLAEMKSISISEFSIINGRLNILGQAKKSDSVTLWLTSILKNKELSNISFEKLKILDIDDGKGFSFELTNEVEGEDKQENQSNQKKGGEK